MINIKKLMYEIFNTSYRPKHIQATLIYNSESDEMIFAEDLIVSMNRNVYKSTSYYGNLRLICKIESDIKNKYAKSIKQRFIQVRRNGIVSTKVGYAQTGKHIIKCCVDVTVDEWEDIPYEERLK